MLACCGLWILLAWGQAPAHAASRALTLGISHPGLFGSPSSPELDLWFSRAADPVDGAGAGLYHHYVVWREIAPPAPGPSFDATDPDDPQYAFSRLDRAVRAVEASGMESMMTVFLAPDFAEGPGRPAACKSEGKPSGCANSGTWKPSPAHLADFAAALATRYSGLHIPPGESDPLPGVHQFEVWNEPNLNVFLTPQVKGRAVGGRNLVGADHYRGMVNAFYDAVHTIQPSAQVAAGANAPFGTYYGPRRKLRIPPLRFLRRLFCVDRVGRGQKLRRTCSAKPRIDALSHHPITGIRGRSNPAAKMLNPDDLGASNFGALRTLLRSAVRLGQVGPTGKGTRELWATETWEFSNPPDPECGVSPAKQARNIQQTNYLIASQGASSVHYYSLADILPERPCEWTGSGLYTSGGQPKPALTAFRFPFLTVRNRKGAVNAWGRAPASGDLVIERKPASGGWRRVGPASVPVTRGNTFAARLGRLRGPARYRATVGGQTSLAWSQSAGRW